MHECKPISSVCSKVCLVAMKRFNQICDDHFFMSYLFIYLFVYSLLVNWTIRCIQHFLITACGCEAQQLTHHGSMSGFSFLA